MLADDREWLERDVRHELDTLRLAALPLLLRDRDERVPASIRRMLDGH